MRGTWRTVRVLAALAALPATAVACSVLAGIDAPRDRPSDGGEAEADAGADDATVESGAIRSDASVADGSGASDASDASAPFDASDAGVLADAGGGASDGGDGSADGSTACAPPPDDAQGVFVDTGLGTDSLSCGTRQAPCKTVQAGLLRAQAVSKATVYVAAGAYFGPVTLVAGVTVWGGWSSDWAPSCDSQALGAVTIAGSDQGSTTVVAKDLGGTATLKTLTVFSKAASSVAPGETVYGISATGTTTTLVLDDVIVQTVGGGAGAAGDAGAAGVGASTGCAAGDAADGGGGAVGVPAPAGTFAGNGYAWTAGGGGGQGGTGQGGTGGGAGQCASQTCYCGPSTSSTCPTPYCAASGTAGCGGTGGGGGAPGGGGGSSVALFASGATVTGSGGLLRAGPGGAGGAGGAGGPGAPGAAGAAGASQACNTTCNCVPSFCCVPGTPVMLDGGAPGGTGGAGGVGGTGAGGPGGWSCAYVALDASVTWAGTRFAIAEAGAGGPPNGPPGVAKDECP